VSISVEYRRSGVTVAAEPAVAVFAPVTVLTVTLESTPDGEDEVHIHPGGQGVWQARMARLLGARPVLCTPLGGETGAVIDALLKGEEIEHPCLGMSASNPTWIHDRRDGEREPLWEGPAFQLGRHEIDELFSATLARGLACGVCVVAGTHEGLGALDPDTYRRLVGDLGAGGVRAVADLSDDELTAALEGRPNVVKVSEDDMRRDGRLSGSGRDGLERLVEALLEQGAERVVVSRAESGAVASDGARLVAVDAPRLDVADARGAGDSMTAGLAVGLARGLEWDETLRIAAAAGAVNVTRHGSGSGRADAIAELADRVSVVEV
jgi:1-phosphofructokinase